MANKKQKQTLMRLFKEQQKLNLELFKRELEETIFKINYKIERAGLELAIENSKQYIKDIYELKKTLNKPIISEIDDSVLGNKTK